MKKLVKKLVSGVLLGSMVLGLLTGCGGDDKTASRDAANSDYDETISFSMTNWYSMTNAEAGYDLEEDAYVQQENDCSHFRGTILGTRSFQNIRSADAECTG